ncbi:MAG TPA: hypothetical protein VI796_02155, partial [Candidatus Thermoplasmatota archaeon]|nr:hypothetical protein [Candidatus Thermoplasmatota archaeon]
MSKVEAVRPRYIAFRIHAARPVSRRALQEALQGGARGARLAEGQAPHLTRYEFPHAIVRTEHDVAAAVRDLL